MPDQKKSFETTLRSAIKGFKRLAILGVGSDLRGDDAAGMLVARGVLNLTKDNKTDLIRVFLGETAPENLTGEIKKYKPTHLFIIDAGDMGREPGDIALVTPDQEIFGAAFSTHKLPIKVLVKYLNESFPVRTSVVIIQPKSVAFGEGVCADVSRAADQVSRAIADLLI